MSEKPDNAEESIEKSIESIDSHSLVEGLKDIADQLKEHNRILDKISEAAWLP